ncbi:MAG: glycosyltransferase [candidate division KSB1 bacterium]|nr:glycosyltransferase [candidate division KSB1 bacterium]
MKIFLVGTAYPLRGGIAHYIALLYTRLKQNHQVKIISFKRQYPALLFPGKTQEDKSQEVLPVDSEPLLDSINPVSWFRTFWKIRTEKPELVIYKYWMPFFAPCYGTIAILTRLFTRSRTLFICDNIIPHERRLGDGLLTRWAIGAVDYFIVQSEVVRQELLAFRPKANYREVPHPVFELFQEHYTPAAARSRLGIAEDEKVILFFGYIRAYKGLEYLIKAMPKVLKVLKARLLIAGECYEDKEKYTHLIQTLGLEQAVLFKDDYIPNEEVGLYFAAAQVVVLPYISASQSGIVQIAYNYNKPVITTDVGGLPEVIIDGITGYVVPSRNPEALADAIVRYFQEEKEKEFSQNIQKEKQKYSWERMVAAIESFVA